MFVFIVMISPFLATSGISTPMLVMIFLPSGVFGSEFSCAPPKKPFFSPVSLVRLKFSTMFGSGGVKFRF